MEKNKKVRRKKGKKKNRPKIRFNFGVLLTICVLTFAVCFVLYMLAANMNDDFLKDEFGITPGSTIETSSGEVDTVKPSENVSGEAKSSANPVPQSAAVDKSYFDNCCLITDGTLMAIDSFDEKNIFGGENIGVTNAMTEKVSSSFGNSSVCDIVKQKKPQILYIMLGNDIGTASSDEIIAAYTKLLSSIKSAVTDIKIYVMQYPPALYDTETVTNDMINDYNAKILSICNDLGVYCIDTNTALKGEDGKLSEEYWSYETLTLSQAGYDKLTEYILTHVAG